MKKHFDNHHIIKEAKYKSKATTVKPFDMFKEDYANYPYLLKRTTPKSQKVKGELYEINNDNILKKLDKFEDAPNYYQRCKIVVKNINGKIRKADAYFMKEHKIPKNQQPLEEWLENQNSFLSEFEEYYKRNSNKC